MAGVMRELAHICTHGSGVPDAEAAEMHRAAQLAHAMAHTAGAARAHEPPAASQGGWAAPDAEARAHGQAAGNKGAHRRQKSEICRGFVAEAGILDQLFDVATRLQRRAKVCPPARRIVSRSTNAPRRAPRAARPRTHAHREGWGSQALIEGDAALDAADLAQHYKAMSGAPRLSLHAAGAAVGKAARDEGRGGKAPKGRKEVHLTDLLTITQAAGVVWMLEMVHTALQTAVADHPPAALQLAAKVRPLLPAGAALRATRSRPCGLCAAPARACRPPRRRSRGACHGSCQRCWRW
jgi:hypothetical protein